MYYKSDYYNGSDLVEAKSAVECAIVEEIKEITDTNIHKTVLYDVIEEYEDESLSKHVGSWSVIITLYGFIDTYSSSWESSDGKTYLAFGGKLAPQLMSMAITGMSEENIIGEVIATILWNKDK